VTATPDVDVRRLPAGVPSRAATIDAVAWIAGRWVGDGLGGTVEEVYSPAVGGVILGHVVVARRGEPAFLELVQIREEHASLVYRVKHFDPDLKAHEEKDDSLDFRLVGIAGARIYFDGLTIERVVPDRMVQWMRSRTEGGAEEILRIDYGRAG